MNSDPICQFNIFLNIAQPLYSEVVSASQKIGSEFPNSFILDGRIKVPHFSLYLFTTPKKNKDLVIQKARSFADKISPTKIRINSVIVGKEGLIMLGFEMNENIYKLHENIVGVFNSLREGTQRKKYADPIYFNSLPDSDKEYLSKYGHKYVFENFCPHVSVAICEDNKKTAKFVKELEHQFVGREALLTSLVVVEDDYETSEAREIIFDSVE